MSDENRRTRKRVRKVIAYIWEAGKRKLANAIPWYRRRRSSDEEGPKPKT